jgi:membrane protein YdbS with pleckstrin-like domain
VRFRRIASQADISTISRNWSLDTAVDPNANSGATDWAATIAVPLTRRIEIAFMRDVTAPPDDAAIFALERPEPALWKLYWIRAICTGPAIFIILPVLYFRYHTLRYRFDEEGIHMKVGILFRREVNVTYARIQDIHLSSGIIQRWLGLADVQIQTASGSAGAELTIEGFKQFEAIRDFLYSKMRGVRAASGAHAPPPLPAGGDNESVRLLLAIRDELRATRELLEGRSGSSRDV